MSKDDKNVFQSLIAGGLIGAALATLLSKDKTLGALAGAVILATYKANQEAKKTHLPICVEENGKLYEMQPDGEKKFIKDIPKPTPPLHRYFRLK
jgi:hypothetical protein